MEPIEKDIQSSYAEAIFLSVMSVMFLVILNGFYDRIPVITDEFERFLPYLNITVILNLIMYVSRIFIRGMRYKHATEVISNFVYLVTAFYFVTLFPFSTSSETWDLLLKLLIGLSALATFISMVSNGIKFVEVGNSEDEGE